VASHPAMIADNNRAPVTSRSPSFIVSIVTILGGQFVSGVIALLAEILYARLLGPAARGTIGLCVVTIAFATLIGGLGGEGAIVYWTSRSRPHQNSYLPAVLSWGALGCCLACGLWSWSFWKLQLPFLRGMSGSSAVVILFSIPAATFFAYSMALAGGYEQFRLRSLCSALRQVVGMTMFLLLLLAFGRQVETALWANFIGLTIGTLTMVTLLRREIATSWTTASTLSNIRPTLTYALRGQVGNLASFFTYRLDIFIVNYFLLPAQVGFYALGVTISEALWQIPQAVASALFPRTVRSADANATQFTTFILRQVLLLNLLGGLAMAAISPFVVPLIFGQRFQPSVSVIWWILPGTIALSLAKVGCADLAGRGKNGYASVFALFCFAVTAILDWRLIPLMGITGAALASSIAYCLDALLVLAALRYEAKIRFLDILIPQSVDLQVYRAAVDRLKDIVRRTTFPHQRELLAPEQGE